jgi:hypothetical protein
LIEICESIFETTKLEAANRPKSTQPAFPGRPLSARLSMQEFNPAEAATFWLAYPTAFTAGLTLS